MKTVLLASVLLIASTGAARAQYAVTPIVAPDAGLADYCGSAVDVKGDLAIVGAWGATVEQPFPLINQGAAGVAYVYRKVGSTWTLEAQVKANDFQALDFYGQGVAIDGTRAAVGSYGDDNVFSTNTGSLYVLRYVHEQWLQEAKLVPSPLLQSPAQFGKSVAIEGTTIVAGGPHYDQPLGVTGIAYVFEHNGTSWVQTVQLLNTSPMHGERFGADVALSGDTIVVGAPRWDCNGGGMTCVGAAFVFRRVAGTWTQEAKLTALDGAAADFFGGGVDIEGDAVVVGAEQAGASGAGSGAAYVFRRTGTTWSQEAKLVPIDGAAGAAFGRSVALSGSTVVVGAPLDPTTGRGSAHVFRHENGAWVQVSKVTLPGASVAAEAGAAVAVDGGTALVGGPMHDGGTTDTGRAWRIEDVSTHPAWNDLGGGLAGAVGVPKLTGAGVLAGGSPVLLTCSGAAPASASTLVIGLSLLCAPFKGGLLVPAPDVLVTGLVVGPGGSWSVGSTWPAGLPAGLDIALQAWTVDAAAPQGLSASDALVAHTPNS